MSNTGRPAAWAAYHAGENRYHAIASTRETLLRAIEDTGHECVLMIPLANIERLVSMRVERIVRILEDVDDVATKQDVIGAIRGTINSPDCIKSFDCANGDHSDACPCTGHEVGG